MPKSLLQSLSRLAILALVLPVVGCGASQTEVDQLKRRVSTLEKRVRQLEGGGGRVTAPRGKAKGKKRRRRKKNRRPQPTGDGRVEVAGDALKVALQADGKNYPVPGKVPEMGYAILASFDDAQEMQKVGSVKIPADKTVTLTCTKATATCEGALTE